MSSDLEHVLDLFHNNPEPMWIYDCETLAFLDVNEAAIQAYGWSRDEFRRMTILDIRPVEDVERVRNSARFSGPRKQSGPWRHIRRDGSERLMRITSHRVEFEGRAARLVSAVDVTEAVRANAALRESEEMFRGISTASPLGIFRAQLDGFVVYVNPRLQQIWKMDGPEILGHGWTRRVHPEDLDSLVASWTRANFEGRDYEHIFRLVMEDGGIRWIHGRSAVMRDESGNPIASIGSVDDFTARMEADEALRINEAELRSITDRLPVAMLYVDAKGCCRRINRAFADWFGFTNAQVLAMSFEQMVLLEQSAAQRDTYREAWQAALDGKPSVMRHRLLIGQSPREVEISYTPDFDRAGSVCGFVILIQDIQERVELEQEFRQAQKMEAVGRLAGGVAHDFNNILSVMIGYARLLEAQLGDDSYLHRMAREIRTSGERAAQLTQQLLAFSRKQVAQPKVYLLDALVEDNRSMLEHLAGRGIQFTINLGAAEAAVKIDTQQFSQSILNLAVNARDAMPGHGTLTIATGVDLEAGFGTVAVTDTGVGIAPDVMERIFEPFFTTKEAGKGTGLGLATTYGIIQQAGGEIVVQSEPGAGSTFTIRLPLSSAKPERPLVNEDDHIVCGTETVLLVEDDESVRKLFRHILEKGGYTVVESASGEQGVQAMQDRVGEIDVIVTDAIMPGIGGRQMIERIRELHPEIPALIVSGHIEDEGSDLAGDPLTAFLYKPVAPGILSGHLRRMLTPKS